MQPVCLRLPPQVEQTDRMKQSDSHGNVLAATKQWLLSAVIGLNLCPFAKSVYVKEQIKYVVSAAATDEQVLEELEFELSALYESDPAQHDTTLLIVPQHFEDFFEFNYFLTRAGRVLKRARLVSVVQIASFHPQFQFGDREANDIENYTNRAPYPILHLLREDSVEKAVAAFPEASDIYERNQALLRSMGHDGWARLNRAPEPEKPQA